MNKMHTESCEKITPYLSYINLVSEKKSEKNKTGKEKKNERGKNTKSPSPSLL